MKKYLQESWALIGEVRPFVIQAIALFCAGVVAGLTGLGGMELLGPLMELAKELEGRGLFGIILGILTNNLLAVLFSIWLGVILGIFPALGAFLNGMAMGIVLSPEFGLGICQVFLLVVPHGIFEFPAMFLAMGSGMWIGMWPFQRGRVASLRTRLVKAHRLFIFVVVPLLIIASVIEGTRIMLMSK